jgi:hypothetical protein
MKVVINTCYGGFDLSHEAMMMYAEKKGIKLYPYMTNEEGEYVPIKDGDDLNCFNRCSWYMRTYFIKDDPNSELFSEHNINRADPALIATIEALKEKANGSGAKLKIVEIPEGIEWEVTEYDGREQVEEKHRVWS